MIQVHIQTSFFRLHSLITRLHFHSCPVDHFEFSLLLQSSAKLSHLIKCNCIQWMFGWTSNGNNMRTDKKWHPRLINFINELFRNRNILSLFFCAMLVAVDGYCHHHYQRVSDDGFWWPVDMQRWIIFAVGKCSSSSFIDDFIQERMS